MQARTLQFSLSLIYFRVLQYSQIIGLSIAYNNINIEIFPLLKVGASTCQLGRVSGPVTRTFVEHSSQQNSQL